jgi:CBS domain containing-hemolysin-like protein
VEFIYNNLLFVASSAGGEVAKEWDSLGSILFQLGVILFFVFLNGFFVAAEFALVKVRASQLDEEILKGKRSAVRARHAVADLNHFLSAGQLGITLASLALGFLGEGFVASLIEPLFSYWHVNLSEGWVRGISIGVAYTFVTFLHITLGEQVPKTLAIRRALGTAMISSGPLHLFATIFRPFIWLLNVCSEKMLKWIFKIDPVDEHGSVHSADELAMLVEQSQGEAVVTSTERDILINALELNDLVVRDIMTPRSEVICLDMEQTFEENLAKAVESEHTRFPLIDGHLDTTLGFVHIKDLMKMMGQEKPSLLDVKREILEVPEMMVADKLLRFLLKNHGHLALAVDEFGGAVGMVTLDNVLEELVGDIFDEFDKDAGEFTEVGEGVYVVSGRYRLHDLEDEIGLILESPDVSTLGGFVTQRIGHLPKTGERAMFEGYEAVVTKTDGRRVIEVQLSRLAALE